MKKSIKIKAAIMLMMTLTVFTACTNDDSLTLNPTDGSALVGNWTVDITGNSFPLWNYGPALHMMSFQADGTGSFNTFYIMEEQPVARDYQTFNYTATSDGHLTMEMEDGTFEYTYRFDDGQLTLSYQDNAKTYDKAGSSMTAKFDEWSSEELIKVPNAARYTIFVYGNAGGKMDYCIEESFWEEVKPLLTDSNNVRVVCFYKYGKDLPEEGKPYTGKYAEPGDIVWFELSSKTDLDKLRENGAASIGFAEQAKQLKLCDPASISSFLQLSSLICPAQEYIFTIWGHGNGFEPMYDIPGKYNKTVTRGLISDQWNNNEKLDMYELVDAIRSTGAERLKMIFFHNCLMGNMESLTELHDVAEYIACSSHNLNSDYTVLPAFIRTLMEKDNVEQAFASMLSEVTPVWQNAYRDDKDGTTNGDLKLLRTAGLDSVINVSRRLADRLVAIYPTQKEAIDIATKNVYRFITRYNDPVYSWANPFFDLQDYSDKLAQSTGDADLQTIADDLRMAFDKAILQSADINWSVQHLDHYSLSVCLYHQGFYNYDYVGAAGNPWNWNCNIGPGYEQSTFHKLTGWGNWLKINTCQPWGNPTSGGGGLAE